jgi:hypothetical protein
MTPGGDVPKTLLLGMMLLFSADALAAKQLHPIDASGMDEDAIEARRQDAIRDFNYNGDYRLRGKEMRHMKKERPRMYNSLVNFCERAKDHPIKNGVVLPKDEHDAKKMKCKKSNVGRAYFAAWGRMGDTPAEEKIENGNDGGSSVKARRRRGR